jgi:C_GCAxxG_C_C family probable redox protein
LLGLRQAKVLNVSDETIRSSTGLAGGCGGQKELCGGIVGGILAIGVQHGRAVKSLDRRPAMERSGKLIEDFQKQFGAVSCRRLVKDFADFNSLERKKHCSIFVAFVAEKVEGLVKGG